MPSESSLERVVHVILGVSGVLVGILHFAPTRAGSGTRIPMSWRPPMPSQELQRRPPACDPVAIRQHEIESRGAR
jgi:hypothetical protein